MKKVILSVFILFAVYSAYSANGKVTLPFNENQAIVKNTKTYANSQVDTVVFTREAGLSGLAFGAHFKDSVSVTNVILRRVVDGAIQPVLAGDTLYSSFASTVDGSAGNSSFLDGVGKTIAVTLAPLADQYLFIVTYAGSANGTTTPTAVYEAVKQLSRR